MYITKLRKSFRCWKWLQRFFLLVCNHFRRCLFKISNLFFFFFFKMKARTFPSLLNVMLYFILFYLILFFLVPDQEVVVCFWTLELLLVCVLAEAAFAQVQTCTIVHFKWSGFSGKPRLSSLTWCPGRPQSQTTPCPRTPSWQTFGLFVMMMVSWRQAQMWGSLFTYEGNSGRAPQWCSSSLSRMYLCCGFWGQLYEACFNEENYRGATIIIVIKKCIKCVFLVLPSLCATVGRNCVKCKKKGYLTG